MTPEHASLIASRPFSPWVNQRHTEAAYESITSALKGLVKGERIMTTSEWAARYRIMPEESAYKRWQPDLHPYLDGISDSICSSDPSEKVVVIGKSVQVGASECVINEVLRRIHQQPCTMLYFMDTKEKMETFMHDRIDQAFAQKPFDGMIEKVGISRYFPGGGLHTYGANSATGLASHPATLVVGDEAAEYKHDIAKSGDFLTLARGRITVAGRKGKIVLLSKFKGTDVTAGSFYGYYVAGDCKEYLCPCLECGEFWLWGIDNLNRDDEGCYLECPKCKGKTREGDQRVEAVAKGKWSASKERDMSDITSYRISGFISDPEWVPLNYIFEQYQSVRKRTIGDMRGFYNNIIGLPYEEGEIKSIEVNECREKMISLGYKHGDVPDDVILLTLGIDVQGGYLEWEVKGWDKDGSCYSIDRGQIRRDIKDVKSCVEEIQAIMKKSYDGLHVWLGCIDSGSGAASSVYQICSRFPDVTGAMGGKVGALVPTKGVSNKVSKSAKSIISYSAGSKRRTGSRRHGKQWGMMVGDIKMELYRTLMTDYKRNADGSLPFGLVFAPIDYPEEYFHEIQSENIHKKTTKTGETHFEFVEKGGIANEALDIHVMNRFAYELLEMPYAHALRMKSIIAWASRWRKKDKMVDNQETVDKQNKEVDSSIEEIRKARAERARNRLRR